MDMLAEGLDPEHTSFVLDTYWVQHGGGDIRDWMEKNCQDVSVGCILFHGT